MTALILYHAEFLLWWLLLLQGLVHVPSGTIKISLLVLLTFVMQDKEFYRIFNYLKEGLYPEEWNSLPPKKQP